VRAGGTGDLRAFQTAFHASLVLAVCAAMVILTAPFLADYAVMNVALFLILFTFGLLTGRISGINFWILLAYITISAFVGLNPQEPVASQTIIDTFLGMTFGMFIGIVLGLDSLPEPFRDGKHAWFAIGQGKQLHIIEGATSRTGQPKRQTGTGLK
jgi:hypothetical protein